MELREEGFKFEHLEDLEKIGFSDKTVTTFKKLNLCVAVAMF